MGLVAVVALPEARGVRIIAVGPGGDAAATADGQALARLWCRREAEAACLAAAAAKIIRRRTPPISMKAVAAAGAYDGQ